MPVASGSYTGLTGLVNTQYNYQDVGVNLEMTARVVEGDEIYMHLKIEISAIDRYDTSTGVSQPVIGQHKIDQELRVKEGDLALIGGMTSLQNGLAVTGIPGLMRIPLLGKLFSGQSANHSRDDLMIAMIPRIVRRPVYTEENLRSIAAGTQTIKLHYAPAAPLDIHVDGQIPGSVDYAPAAPAAPGEGTSPAPAARVLFKPSQMEARISTPVEVAVEIEGGDDVASVPMVIRYDPKLLRLNDVTAGDFMASGGLAPLLTKNIQNDLGMATVAINRPPGQRGVSGPSGVLVKLNFQPLGAGSTTVAISNIAVRNSEGRIIATGNPELRLRIQ